MLWRAGMYRETVSLRSLRTRSGGNAVSQLGRFAPASCLTCRADPPGVAAFHSGTLSWCFKTFCVSWQYEHGILGYYNR